jgi:hypothetical protein
MVCVGVILRLSCCVAAMQNSVADKYSHWDSYLTMVRQTVHFIHKLLSARLSSKWFL